MFLEVANDFNAFKTLGPTTKQHSQVDLSLQTSEGGRGSRTRTIIRHKGRRKKYHDLAALTSKYEKIKRKNIYG